MNPKGDEHKIFTRDGQGELFSEFETEKTKKPGYLFRRDIALGKKITLNLSYENLLLFAIVFIMLLVVFFSLGVEKGKRAAVTHVKVEAYSRLQEEGPAEEKGKITAPVKIAAPMIDKSEKPKVTETAEMAKEKESDVSAKKYTIQVIAFKNAENAEKEMRRLKDKGYEAFIIPSKEWLQVCVGRYENREQSKADFEVLKKRYPSCYFRKIE